MFFLRLFNFSVSLQFILFRFLKSNTLCEMSVIDILLEKKIIDHSLIECGMNSMQICQPVHSSYSTLILSQFQSIEQCCRTQCTVHIAIAIYHAVDDHRSGKNIANYLIASAECVCAERFTAQCTYCSIEAVQNVSI